MTLRRPRETKLRRAPLERLTAPIGDATAGLLEARGLDPQSAGRNLRVVMAEVLGTFGLVFFCAGAAHVNWWTTAALGMQEGALGTLGVGLVNGLAVAVMIYAFWSVSGAQMNPAVSLGLWLAGKLEGRRLPIYIGSQLAGALIGGSVLHGLFRNHTGEGESWLGATLPSGPLWQAIGLEIVLTFFLVYLILQLAEQGRKGPLFALAVGFYIAVAVTLGAHVSGASMNPARSIGPAALAWHWADHWVYWVAPAVGAAIAAAVHLALRDSTVDSMEN